MQAKFNFRGAEEIRIQNVGGDGVTVEYLEGYAEQCEFCQPLGTTAKCADCLKSGNLQKRSTMILSKSSARSLASAIMGAAAEL